MSSLIAAKSLPIPSTIFQLLQSVIGARQTANDFFVKLAADNPDVEIKEQNASHKHFIDTLEDVFQILGGKTWSETKYYSDNDNDFSSTDRSIFTNTFETLRLDGDDIQESDDGSESEQKAPKRQNRARKSKKKASKKSKRKNSGRGRKVDDPLESLPLEDYAFIEESTGTASDYLVAVYKLVTEFLEMRAQVQSVWHDVAYQGKNSAVAAAVSQTAVAISRRSASDFFTEFAGHDSYEKIFHTVLKSMSIDANTILLADCSPSAAKSIPKFEGVKIDPKEQLSLYAYHDMKDFIIDWQKTKSRKPTESMLAQIGSWDPSADLRQLSYKARIRWRRSYTINWLYDLLYVYMKDFRDANGEYKERGHDGLKWNRESVKHYHSPFFGLNDFADFLFTLANQPYGTDIGKKILPNHVFQLQCIVDSMTASRGWPILLLGSDVIGPPPDGFLACRDLNPFLGFDTQKDMFGFFNSSGMAMSMLKTEESFQNINCKQSEKLHDDIELLRLVFQESLGMVAKLGNGIPHSTPSRFSSTNTNGIWEYSPYLCGIGLLEGLELAYLTGVTLWDKTPEVMMMMHIHNKLVHKGYLKAPVNLFTFLELEFSHQFFVDGKPPTSKFHEHLVARLRKINDGGTNAGYFSQTHRTYTLSKAEIETANLHKIFDADINRYFRKTRVAHHLRAADWDVARLPDKDLPMTSLILLNRICKITDSEPETMSVEDKLLLDRARTRGIADATLASMMSRNHAPNTNGVQGESKKKKDSSRRAQSRVGHQGSRAHMPVEEILAVVEADMVRDTDGRAPVLGMNLVLVFVCLQRQYTQVMGKLKESQNPLYEVACKSEPVESSMLFRVILARLVLFHDNEECLRTFSDAMEGPCYSDFLYWEGGEKMEDGLE